MSEHHRAVALSQQLAQTHRRLSGRLAVLRDQIAAGTDDGDFVPRLPEPEAIDGDLLVHCLAFCASMHTHHSSEDNQLLPELRAAEPRLGAVLDGIVQDHILVASLLHRVSELCRRDNPSDPEKIVRELDGLAAILETHFAYEEQRIGDALDELGPGEWTTGVLTVA